ncbi:MAG TPA: AzlD domain-containing protein [Burkholderiaceae bacterium]|jgi:branched-subunit amino acid transport protein|nr:AzlD domain-containing protein [Burkholderiaceae bacterium]
MNSADTWLTIALLVMATLLTRAGSFALFGKTIKLPPKMQHALRYAPAAALAAIVVPDLVLADGAISLTWANPKLMAGLGAALFFVATRHLLGTIMAGMALFTVLRLVL